MRDTIIFSATESPYTLNSYAGFGEAYYNVLPATLKLTGGLRWTEDQKHFTDIPSELSMPRVTAILLTGVVNISNGIKFTGRAAVNWTPKLDFTDQTLVCTLPTRTATKQAAPIRRDATFFIAPTGSTVSNVTPDPSPDVQAGIRRCVRAWFEEHVARWSAYAEWRRILLQLRELSDFPHRRPHLHQRQFQCACERRGARDPPMSRSLV